LSNIDKFERTRFILIKANYLKAAFVRHRWNSLNRKKESNDKMHLLKSSR
jgi:hypothetical protein